ncbi:hemerythrin domain-containing protein [Chitinolyticbacter albus]|uniref:hemerythrin domain-containing protein n=1 Tax=Chitinolyticbacter albus TaxID=2961951 RepID=UPI002109D93B|nr:hemerythrin domain-containing protein [Chitinolyticbacter albus]
MQAYISPPGRIQARADFDDPIQLLIACHDKVRRFAKLTAKLAEHVAREGADRQAIEAAQQIIRYFDIAAPLHHADEEVDLFPALAALGDPVLCEVLQQIEQEHEPLAQLWQAVRRWLLDVTNGLAIPPPAALASFVVVYPEHAAREELLIYGAATRLPDATLRSLGQRIVARRKTAPTDPAPPGISAPEFVIPGG